MVIVLYKKMRKLIKGFYSFYVKRNKFLKQYAMIMVSQRQQKQFRGKLLFGLITFFILWTWQWNWNQMQDFNGNQHDVKGSVVFRNITQTRASLNKWNDSVLERPLIHYLVSPGPLGRLGNLMFEFASSAGIAHSLNYMHVIKPSHPLLKYFNIKNILHTEVENLLIVRERQWRNITWRKGKEYLTHNITLRGYFQHWKDFMNISSKIRETFKLKPEYINPAKEFLTEHIPRNKTFIGIHVRRGDFLSEGANKEGRVVADKHYIRKATEYFRNKFTNAFFVVVSDDKEWCKANIVGNDTMFSDFKDPIIDLAIMSLCNHTITTCGTFSWWSGWLAGGIVIYLNDFPRPGSPLEHFMDFKNDYYPPDWIGMSNG